jgi:opacity protein-like surface antigen
MIIASTTSTSLVAGSTVLDYQTKIDWFGTVRARIGYVWGNGDVMSYLTGGLAYGKVDLEGTRTVTLRLIPVGCWATARRASY